LHAASQDCEAVLFEEHKMPRKTKEKAPDSCEHCTHWDEVKDRVRVKKLLESAIEKLGKKLAGSTFQPSLADYLKLMQLEKEFGDDEAKEIKVTWVEPERESVPGK
jgi:hypothetical protein